MRRKSLTAIMATTLLFVGVGKTKKTVIAKISVVNGLIKNMRKCVISGLLIATLSACGANMELPETNILKEGAIIGCVGDSTTYGSGVMKTRDTDSYPAQLQKLLETKVKVENYGMGSQTVMPGTNAPYREHSIYEESQKEPADIYIIMMGTNDAKNLYWDAEKYETELGEFIQSYQELDGLPQIYLMTPVSVFVMEGKTEVAHGINAENLDMAAEITVNIAEKLDLPLIDIHALTAGHPEWYNDGVHPNAEGNAAIALAVYDALKQKS